MIKSLNTFKIKSNIENQLRKAGAIVRTSNSRKSESAYVEAWTEDGLEVKIRISNHELPGYYDAPDLNVGGGYQLIWQETAIKALQMLGLDLTPTLKGYLTKKNNQAAAQASEDQKWADANAQARQIMAERKAAGELEGWGRVRRRTERERLARQIMQASN